MPPDQHNITAVIRDPVFLEHLTDQGHPENPGRLAAIHNMLDQPDMRDLFLFHPPRLAEMDEILMVHSLEHYNRIAAVADKEFTALTPDTFACQGSFRAALYAAGGVCEAVSLAISGAASNGFALIRPPGHHAEKNRAMGYCLFNNTAAAAAFARHSLGLDRVLIVDWDLHHGNGTQHIFEQDPSVLFFSVHQTRMFPGTGDFREVGLGRGEGFTINIPLPKGCGDQDYATLFENLLSPVALKFRPDLILVSAGFDTHRLDPMGGMNLTETGYAALTRSLMETARQTCNGRLVLCLEGGYNLDALAGSVKAVLLELSNQTRTDVSALAGRADNRRLEAIFKKTGKIHNGYWGI